MTRKIKYKDVKLKFVTHWTKCDCGCEKEYMFAPMWERSITNVYGKLMTHHYSTHHLNKAGAYDNSETKRKCSDVTSPTVLNIEDIRSSLSRTDYLALPYNLHVFHINVNAYDGFHRFYIYRIQEIPNCQASSEFPELALSKLRDHLKDMIYKMLNDGIDPPLPQQFDPDFIEWKQDEDLTVHTK